MWKSSCFVILVFLFLFAYHNVAIAAEGMTQDAVQDSTGENLEDHLDAVALPDTSKVATRSFDSDLLEQLRSDRALQYQEAPTAAETLWDRLKAWVRQFWNAIFKGAMDTDWGRLAIILLGLIVVIVIIMMVLKVNAFKVFTSGPGAPGLRQGVLEEDIHAMDFEKLIQEAVARSDYRAGVRLIFLYALKILSDKHFIYWNQGKTNHDYVEELTERNLKTGFTSLNHYFEYAWYGNFRVSPELFAKIETLFNDWRRNIR